MLKRIPGFNVAVDPQRIVTVHKDSNEIILTLKAPDEWIELSLKGFKKEERIPLFEEILSFANGEQHK